MRIFAEEEIRERLDTLNGWALVNGEITKTYVLSSFHRAIGFVVQIGMLADAADHHPDLMIEYNRVAVTLSTHSAGGITERDFRLAEKIEEALAS